MSKYAPSSVSNPKDQMSHFLTRVSEELQEDCQSAIPHDNMNTSRIMDMQEGLRRKDLSEKL